MPNFFIKHRQKSILQKYSVINQLWIFLTLYLLISHDDNFSSKRKYSMERNNLFKISKRELLSIVQEASFTNCGDKYERQYSPFLKDKFSNCEQFWKYFIVPMTRRLEYKEKQGFESITIMHNDISNQSGSCDFEALKEASKNYDASSEFDSLSFNDEGIRKFIMDNNIQVIYPGMREAPNRDIYPGLSGYYKNSIIKKDCVLLLREGIDPILEDIGSLHYTIFLNLVYACEHINGKELSFFEDFYAKLATTFDLIENLLLKIYFLINECNGEKSGIAQKLSKEEFVKYAEEWYDKAYDKLFQNYYSKGKATPIKIPHIKDILNEYLRKIEVWKIYCQYSQKIRTYRNFVVHNIQIGRIEYNKQKYVPKLEKIENYKRWSQVSQASLSENEMKNNFDEMKQHMKNSYCELLRIFNELWNKPINDLKQLLYEEKNAILLEKYHLNILD